MQTANKLKEGMLKRATLSAELRKKIAEKQAVRDVVNEVVKDQDSTGYNTNGVTTPSESTLPFK